MRGSDFIRGSSGPPKASVGPLGGRRLWWERDR